MFPSSQDVAEFTSEFGSESIIDRIQIAHLGCWGTQVCAVITPKPTKEETLMRAWELIRGLAVWVLKYSSDLPRTERYSIIVGWSQSVRPAQGQIFKAVGTVDAVQAIAGSSDWNAFEQAMHQQVLLSNWEKDLFENHAA